MTDDSVLKILVGTLCAKGEITAQDVLQLRGQVFPDGIVSTAEANAVFHLDQYCKIKGPDWTRFYVDVLTDYFVWQSNPRGYVSEEQAAQLIEEIKRDGCVEATSELELLINIVHWCTHCPESLALLALEAIKESILSPGTACYGSNRPPRNHHAIRCRTDPQSHLCPGKPGRLYGDPWRGGVADHPRPGDRCGR